MVKLIEKFRLFFFQQQAIYITKKNLIKELNGL